MDILDSDKKQTYDQRRDERHRAEADRETG